MPSKKRVFISFGYDNDLQLKEGLVGQARLDDSPFEIADFSLKEAEPEAQWLRRAREAITRSEVVIVMLGRRTHGASGVAKEVRVANELRKRIFQLRPQGNEAQSYIPVPSAGTVHVWT